MTLSIHVQTRPGDAYNGKTLPGYTEDSVKELRKEGGRFANTAATKDLAAQAVIVASSKFYGQTAYQGGVFMKSLAEKWIQAQKSDWMIDIWKSHPTDDTYWQGFNAEQQATKKLEHCCYEELRDFKKVNRVVISGSPEEVIVKYAKEKGVDLIVMGTQTKSGMDFVFKSSVDKVIKKAECPVLCVKAPAGKTA